MGSVNIICDAPIAFQMSSSDTRGSDMSSSKGSTATTGMYFSLGEAMSSGEQEKSSSDKLNERSVARISSLTSDDADDDDGDGDEVDDLFSISSPAARC